MSSRPLRVFRLNWVIGSVIAHSSLLSAAPNEVDVQSSGDCPSANEVSRQLQQLLPNTKIQAGAGHGTVVLIQDTSASFRVTVLGSERHVEDPKRDCIERARVAAVLAALALDPPEVALTPETKTEAKPAPKPPPASVSADGALYLGAEGALAGSSAFGAGPTLRLRIGHRAVAVDAALAWLSPVHLELDGAGAQLQRTPLALSMLGRYVGRRWEHGVGLGAALDVLHVEGRGSDMSHSGTRATLGPRVSAYTRLRIDQHWGAFSELAVAYFPRPFQLEVVPRGIVGETPRVWAGLSLGATLNFL